MKRFMLALITVVLLSVPTLAGDIDTGGKPCTENCGATQSIDEGNLLLDLLIDFLIP